MPVGTVIQDNEWCSTVGDKPKRFAKCIGADVMSDWNCTGVFEKWGATFRNNSELSECRYHTESAKVKLLRE